MQIFNSGIVIPAGYWLSGPDADRMFHVLPGSEPAGPFEASTAQQLHDLLQMGRDVVLTGNIDYVAADILDESAGTEAPSIIKIADSVKLDLAGYTVTYTPNGAANKFFELTAGGNLTITGNGTIKQKVILENADNGAMFRVAAGTLTIKNGNFLSVYEGISSCATKRYTIWNGGSGIVNIEGGTFSNDCTRVISEASGVTVTGGKFSSDPTAYGVNTETHSAVVVVESGKTWYEVLPPVQVSTAQQLKEAIESGRSVVLAQNITYDLDSNITSKRIVKLDLGSYTITWSNNKRIDVYGGTLTVTGTTGGLVQNNGSIFRVNGGSVNLAGGNYTASDRVIWSGGNDSEVINVTGGTFNGKLQAYSGAMNITGGIFNKEVYTSRNDLVAELTITGGTFNDQMTVGEGSSCSVSGGTFKNSPAEYLAQGYDVVLGADNMYHVEPFASVTTAQGLKEALEAGKNIKLGEDLTIDAAVVMNSKSAVLDLNGKQLSVAMSDSFSGAFITLNSSNLTIRDGSAGKTGKISAVCTNSCTTAMPVIKVAAADSTLTVDSGTIDYAFDSSYTGTPAGELHLIDSNGAVVINDGTFTNAVGGKTVNGIAGTVSVNGGKFSRVPSTDAATITWKTGYIMMKPVGEELYCYVAIPDGYTKVSGYAELKQALESGEKAWLINDITFQNNSTDAFSSGVFINITGGKKPVVDLNGFKLTFMTDSTRHVIQLNNAELTFEDNSSAKTGVVEVAYNGGAAHFVRVNGSDTLRIEDGITVRYVLADGVQMPTSGNRNLIHSNGALEINATLDNQIGGDVFRQLGSKNVTLNGGKFNKRPGYNGDWTGSVLPTGTTLTQDNGWFVVTGRQDKAVANASELKTYLEQGESVYLTSDITVSNSDFNITISNKMTEFTLDLNGHTITANIESTDATHLISLVKSKMRITDTSTQKNGGIVAQYASTAANNTGVIRVNHGNSYAYLTIDAGNFSFVKATEHTRNNSRIIFNSGSTTINGGTFTGFANDTVFCYTSGTPVGVLNINGGTFVSYKPRTASGGTMVLKTGYQWSASSPYTLQPISG